MHSRLYYAEWMEPGDRLKAAREAAGYENATLAAEALGVPAPTYLAHENGSRGIPASRAKQYADFFRTNAEWILYGPGSIPPRRGLARGTKTVPLVGYVAADPSGQAVLFSYGQGPFDEVAAPEDATPKTVAAEVRGQSLGPVFDRWLVYYDDVRDPITPDLIGELCVVALLDGTMLVKQLRRAPEGRFHLISNSGEQPMFDVELAWAAKVKTMKPRG